MSQKEMHEFTRLGRTIRYFPEALVFHEVTDSRVGAPHPHHDREVWPARDPDAFSKLFVVLTEACNMNCAYCYTKETGRTSSHRRLDEQAFQKTVREMIASHCGQLNISFVGGEPLLAWDALRAMLAFAHQVCDEGQVPLGLEIVTNGTLLTPDKMALLAPLKPRILLSLDGAPERHDRHRRMACDGPSFQEVFRHLPDVLKIYDAVEVLAIMTRSETDIDRVVIELAELGFKRIGVNLVSTKNRDHQYCQEDLPALDAAYSNLVEWLTGTGIEFMPFAAVLETFGRGIDRQFYCHAGVESLTVDTEGHYCACPLAVGLPEAQFGSSAEGVDREALAQYRDRIRRTNVEACQACWARTSCGGGCMWRNYAMSGHLGHPAPLECRHQKMRMEWAMTSHLLRNA